jgi:hypothetical protein
MSLDIEVYTWDEERIKDEVTLRLSPEWTFKVGPSEDHTLWEASITNAEGVEVWSDSALTAQLVLLDALGWLESRQHKVAETSPWVRRRGELDAQRVHEIAYSKSFGPPDPPHLDVTEIDSVVRSARKGK